LISVSNKITD